MKALAPEIETNYFFGDVRAEDTSMPLLFVIVFVFVVEPTMHCSAEEASKPLVNAYFDEQNFSPVEVEFQEPKPFEMGNTKQIGLKCPASTDDGTLVFTSIAAGDLSTVRGVIVYQNGRAISVETQTWNADGSPYKHHFINFKTEQDQTTIDAGHRIVGYLDESHTEVCGGSAEVKKKFSAKLSANRAYFRGLPKTPSASPK